MLTSPPRSGTSATRRASPSRRACGSRWSGSRREEADQEGRVRRVDAPGESRDGRRQRVVAGGSKRHALEPVVGAQLDKRAGREQAQVAAPEVGVRAAVERV